MVYDFGFAAYLGTFQPRPADFFSATIQAVSEGLLDASLILGLQAVGLSLLPGAFWLVYVESRSPQASSKGRLASCALAGAVSVLGVELFHRCLPWNLSQPPAQAALSLLYFWWIVGVVEESCKFLATSLVGLPRRDFQSPWDGLSCASASALGFATAENVHYVLTLGKPSVLLGRSLLSTFAHVVMSAFWGYALGAWKQGSLSLWGILGALLWGALGHGLYDWFLTLGLWPLALLTLGAMIWSFGQRRQEARLSNRALSRWTYRVSECRQCRSLSYASYPHCPFCGGQERAESVVCQACLQPASGAACPECGAQFIEVASPGQSRDGLSSLPESEPR